MASVSTDRRTGNLVVRAYAGLHPVTRKPMSVCETLRPEASEDEIKAAKARQDARAAVTKGDPSLMTVGTLLDYHIDCLEADGAAPGTVDAYRSYRRRHVERIASVRVEKADAALFSRLYRDLRRPVSEGGAGLSVVTVEKIHAMLSGCFSTAKADGRLPANPLLGVKVPRGRSPEARPLSSEDFARLRAWIDRTIAEPVADDEGFERCVLACLARTALHGGFRRGELAGFRRMHREERRRVEGGRATVERGLRVARVRARKTGAGVIEKDPKSEASKRFVTMDEGSEAVLDGLAEVQEAVLAGHGVAVGPETHLFTHADGAPLDPKEITDAMGELAAELGLAPWVRTHTLRHTHATYLIRDGWDMKAVQHRLGQASLDVTMNRYSHVLPGRDGEVAAGFAGISDRMAEAAPRAAPRLRAPCCPLPGAAGACPLARNAG